MVSSFFLKKVVRICVCACVYIDGWILWNMQSWGVAAWGVGWWGACPGIHNAISVAIAIEKDRLNADTAFHIVAETQVG